MSTHLTISATDFKAKCLDIFTRLSDRRLSGVTVVRRGKAVAELSPPRLDGSDVPSLHGCMAGSVIFHEPVDLTAPIFDGEMDADLGILYR